LLTVELSDVTKQGGRRNLQYTGVIDPGDSFKFRVTDVRNPYSFRPTDSLIYRVFTSDNVLFEELDEGMIITNTLTGNLSQYKNGLVPTVFESDVLTNYTVEVLPVNYEQNMNIIIYLPDGKNETSKIKLPSEEEGVECFGIQGTDNAGSEDNELECTVNYE